MTTLIKSITHHDVYPLVDPTTNQKLIESTTGKSVIITGAGAGIGRGISEQFARAGATTFFLSVLGNTTALKETADLIKSINPQARVFTQTLDITSQDQVEKLFSFVKTTLGTSADVLINNAGISGQVKSTGDSDPEEYWRTIEVTLKGPYLMSRAFIRSTIEAGRKGGAMVQVSSLGAYYSIKDLGAYQIGKIGVNRLNEFIQLEHAKDGITSVSIHPGGVLTGWWHGIPEDNPLTVLKQHMNDSPLLSGGVCVYLTTPEAAYLSGRFVSINWDLEELSTHKEEIVKNGLLLMIAKGDEVPAPY